ncbi:SLATT domain-containing protein [Succinatimonas hippei]|uniref:SLATT domain-containing protein n=1 Tax=Succinatimonas hippei TaxID=626938 RepID=UPI002011400D|nr:SLATT domain-containing protein [Succinatimonas hippei]MCL1604279.1 SLATT domain-containing protein [Succinatimonas hippei]
MSERKIDPYIGLEDLVRNAYASVVWSHKIQEKQSDIYADRFSCLTLSNIILAGLSSAGIITIIFTDPYWLKIISALVAFLSFLITAYFKSFNLLDLNSAHKTTANQLISIRDRYKSLLFKIKYRMNSVTELFNEYQGLQKETSNIYLEAPSTTCKAVAKASEALKVKKDNTFTDEEIDSFLPSSLRRKIND